MGIVFGFLTLFCFCLLAGKVFTRKLQMKKADGIFKKIHKPLYVMLLISGMLHILCIVPVIRMRSIWILMTGAAVIMFILMILIFCHTIKKKETKLRWHRLLSILAVLLILCHMIAYSIDFKDYQTKVNQIQIQGMDALGLQNGKYTGTYDVGYIRVKAEVTVKEGKIEHIEIKEHRNERGKPAEAVVDEIIKEQKTDVDAVTGATNSSNVIKRAVEDALQN